MEQDRDSSVQRIAWHPLYIGSLHIELWDYLDCIEIHEEVSLTEEPLKIDGIIIKKRPGLVIDKNFARIFRGHNIIEFKSPADYFSIHDFYKCYAYVCLYAALKKEADISDMTLTVIESRYPEKVVKHLTGARGYRVERMYTGIYEVVGDFVPIQFIVTPELSDEDNLFLKNLSRNVKVESLIEIFKAVRSRMEDGAVRSYLNAVVEANPKTMKEIGSMAVTQEFKDVMENLSFVKEMKQQWQAERSQMEAERLQIEAENAALRAQLAALTQQ